MGACISRRCRGCTCPRYRFPGSFCRAFYLWPLFTAENQLYPPHVHSGLGQGRSWSCGCFSSLQSRHQLSGLSSLSTHPRFSAVIPSLHWHPRVGQGSLSWCAQAHRPQDGHLARPSRESTRRMSLIFGHSLVICFGQAVIHPDFSVPEYCPVADSAFIHERGRGIEPPSDAWKAPALAVELPPRGAGSPCREFPDAVSQDPTSMPDDLHQSPRNYPTRVATTGVEPVTPRFSGGCSYQLS